MTNDALNQQVFQSLYFMQQVFQHLEKAVEDDEVKLDEYWGADASEDEDGPAAYVVIDMREKGKKDSMLDVTRWFPVGGCAQTLGLYVNVLRNDEEGIWDGLKEAFPEAFVDEDEQRLGFPWALPADATRAQIKEAAAAFAARLVGAIWE